MYIGEVDIPVIGLGLVLLCDHSSNSARGRGIAKRLERIHLVFHLSLQKLALLMEINSVIMRIDHLLRHFDLSWDEIVIWEIHHTIDRISSSHIHLI